MMVYTVKYVEICACTLPTEITICMLPSALIELKDLTEPVLHIIILEVSVRCWSLVMALSFLSLLICLAPVSSFPRTGSEAGGHHAGMSTTSFTEQFTLGFMSSLAAHIYKYNFILQLKNCTGQQMNFKCIVYMAFFMVMLWY
jgi:hypothetical protein